MNRSAGEKGLLWNLPVIKSNDFGKLGPAFGFGAGCGLGFGVGILGGVGIGPGIPGLQVGFGLGAGCGIGLGFGYGMGKGIAQDEYRRYTNVGNPFRNGGNIISEDDITAIVDDFVIHTKKLIRATSKEIEKWRR
ncbi:unnamed protein product [Lupinus luteus]|uniref:Uncharacterized protein n=1 Tax=Lupinus luteus TaxID=3873 RepID=A0AAV1Y466_LUPLU